MPRHRTHATAPRSKTVTIRLTPDEHLRCTIDARRAGLSVSGFCERLVCDGKVEATRGPEPMDPALLQELRRIGNNVNQVAHALNSNLPPDVQFAYRQARDLLRVLGEQVSATPPQLPDPQKMFVQQIAEALSPRNPSNDPSPAQARHVFQRSVQVHPARRGQGHD